MQAWPFSSGAQQTTTTVTAEAGAEPTLDIGALKRARVVLATREGCPFCKAAKAALNQAKIEYVEFNAEQNAELRQAVKDASGRSSVPQVFVGGKSFGGSDDLQAGLQDGSFKKAWHSRGYALPQSLLQTLEKVSSQQRASSSAPLKAGAQQNLSQSQKEQAEALKGLQGLMADGNRGLQRTQRAASWKRKQYVFTGQELIAWLGTYTASSDNDTVTPLATKQQAQLARKWVQARIGNQGGGGGPFGNWGAGAAQAAAPAGQAGNWLSKVAGDLLVANVISPATDRMPPADATPVIEPQALYHLAAESPVPEKGEPLNTQYWWTGPARPANEVALSLRSLILRLYDKHLSTNGRSVDYKGIKADPLFNEYVQATAELQRIDLTPLNREELCALFINLYNALIVHALAVRGAPANPVERTSFFTRDAAYCISGHTYSADDMENGVLRGNRPAASNLFALVGINQLARAQFGPFDPRLSKVVKPMDPRIHFALVCGAKSCPPISVYTAENLEEGLQAAGETFCAGEVEVNRAKRTVRLSMIMKWYSVDFGANDTEKLRFVLGFLKGKQREELQALLSDGGRINVEYKPYDWALNE